MDVLYEPYPEESMMLEYIVVHQLGNLGKFQRRVNNHIEGGWRLQGGTSLSRTGAIRDGVPLYRFAQAMVKEKE